MCTLYLDPEFLGFLFWFGFSTGFELRALCKAGSLPLEPHLELKWDPELNKKWKKKSKECLKIIEESKYDVNFIDVTTYLNFDRFDHSIIRMSLKMFLLDKHSEIFTDEMKEDLGVTSK
jgi:hypothetical protein